MPLPATDDYSAVQAYFTAKEWVEISNYEKLRLKNIKENYEMMIELGLQVSPPYFMRPRRGRKKQFVEESDSEDKEWKPKRARKKSRGDSSTPSKAPAVKSNQPVITKKQPEPKPHTVTSGTVYDDDGNPLNNAHPTVSEIIIDLLEWKDYADSTQTQTNPTASSGDQGNQSGDQETEQTLTGVASGGDHSTKQSQSSCMKVGGRAGEKAKSFSDRIKGKPQPSPRLSLYPRRAVSCKSYKEDDYCVDCHEVFEGGCSKHSLTIIKDNPSPKGSKDKARKTLPDGLPVKPSSIPGAGQGIFATNFIPKGYLFIPYASDIVDLELGNDSSNALEICKEGKPHHYVDSNSEQTGNWMRYINCEGDQNLVAFQYLDSGLYRCAYCGSLYAIPLILARHLKYKHGHYGILPPADAPKEDILQFIKGEIQKPIQSLGL